MTAFCPCNRNWFNVQGYQLSVSCRLTSWLWTLEMPDLHIHTWRQCSSFQLKFLPSRCLFNSLATVINILMLWKVKNWQKPLKSSSYQDVSTPLGLWYQSFFFKLSWASRQNPRSAFLHLCGVKNLFLSLSVSFHIEKSSFSTLVLKFCALQVWIRQRFCYFFWGFYRLIRQNFFLSIRITIYQPRKWQFCMKYILI